MAHWSLGSREQSWTVPGGCGPSTDRPAAWLTNLQEHTRSGSLIKSLQGQKEKSCKNNREGKYKLPQNTLFIGLCDALNIWLPSLQFVVMQIWRLHPDLWECHKTDESERRGAKLLDWCTHFHLAKIALVFQSVWLCDKLMERSCQLQRETYFFYPTPRTQHTFLLHDTIRMCCSLIIGSSNACIHNAKEKKCDCYELK